jgi:acyl-homoserine lactone acylase PvdQ
MGAKNGKWLSLKTQNRSLDGLIQSWTRIKSKNLADFKKSLDYRANLSNNTVYADADGNIAYWHGNYMPKRNPAYNWNLPVDGSTSATEWIGMHTIDELVNVINPASGWIQNTNNTPFSVSGISSPKKEKYATYFAPDAENFRGLNAVRLLSAKKIFSESDLIQSASDMHLTAFDTSLPYLFAAFENIKTTNLPLYNQVKDAIEVLKLWDKN